jgi:hypothetical protein
MKNKKQVKVFSSIEEFEDLINREDVEVLQMDVKGCEESFSHQEGFIGVVLFKIIEE